MSHEPVFLKLHFPARGHYPEKTAEAHNIPYSLVLSWNSLWWHLMVRRLLQRPFDSYVGEECNRRLLRSRDLSTALRFVPYHLALLRRPPLKRRRRVNGRLRPK